MIYRAAYATVLLVVAGVCNCSSIQVSGTRSRSFSQTGSAITAATANAVDASLYWWYSSTAYEAASTISIELNNHDVSTGWTIYAATETYDVFTAISTSSCDEPTTTVTLSHFTYIPTDCTTYPKHVAASTTAVFINAYRTPNATTGLHTPYPYLGTTVKPAAVTIGTKTISTKTPFVEFSQYEVVNCASNSCRTTAYNLSTPYAFQYTGSPLGQSSNSDATITGTLDASFISYISKPSVLPGTWSAQATVIVVVYRTIVVVEISPASIVASSAIVLATPHPTLPFQYSSVSHAWILTGFTPMIEPTAHVEVTQQWLLLPQTTTPSIPALPEQTSTADSGGILPPVSGHNAVSPDAATTQPPPPPVPMFLVDGQTAYAGGSAITQSGAVLSVKAGGLLVWTSSTETSSLQAPVTGTFTVHGMVITATTGVVPSATVLLQTAVAVPVSTTASLTAASSSTSSVTPDSTTTTSATSPGPSSDSSRKGVFVEGLVLLVGGSLLLLL